MALVASASHLPNAWKEEGKIHVWALSTLREHADKTDSLTPVCRVRDPLGPQRLASPLLQTRNQLIGKADGVLNVEIRLLV
jgi:hypothetical protein